VAVMNPATAKISRQHWNLPGSGVPDQPELCSPESGSNP
jgi:hypothetical protein